MYFEQWGGKKKKKSMPHFACGVSVASVLCLLTTGRVGCPACSLFLILYSELLSHLCTVSK